jgi:hypothetical protein
MTGQVTEINTEVNIIKFIEENIGENLQIIGVIKNGL